MLSYFGTVTINEAFGETKKINSRWTHFMRGLKMGPDPFWKIQILLNSHSKIHEKKASDSPLPTENKIIHGTPGLDYHYKMDINKKKYTGIFIIQNDILNKYINCCGVTVPLDTYIDKIFLWSVVYSFQNYHPKEQLKITFSVLFYDLTM